MYICICQAVTDGAIRKAVEAGASSFRDLSVETGCGRQCGSCVRQARDIMDQALADNGAPPARTRLQVISAA